MVDTCTPLVKLNTEYRQKTRIKAVSYIKKLLIGYIANSQIIWRARVLCVLASFAKNVSEETCVRKL